MSQFLGGAFDENIKVPEGNHTRLCKTGRPAITGSFNSFLVIQ